MVATVRMLSSGGARLFYSGHALGGWAVALCGLTNHIRRNVSNVDKASRQPLSRTAHLPYARRPGGTAHLGVSQCSAGFVSSQRLALVADMARVQSKGHAAYRVTLGWLFRLAYPCTGSACPRSPRSWRGQS